MIVVAVEGPTDAAIVRTILRKLGYRAKVYVMRGNRLEKLRRMLRTLTAEKVIVLKDLHRHREEDVLHMLRNLENLDDRVVGVLVKRAIEAWILADPSCLESKLRVRVSVRNPEELEDPAEELDRIMRLAGRRYVKSYRLATQLAECINVERAKGRARSLAMFIDAITSLKRSQ